MRSDEDFHKRGYKENSYNKLNKYIVDKEIDKYEKIINEKDLKKLEKIGKNARKRQSTFSKAADLGNKISKDPIINDPDYASALKGLIDKNPIKDKEKMKRNNIKLGYQIAKNYSDARKAYQNESIDIASLLREAADLLDKE